MILGPIKEGSTLLRVKCDECDTNFNRYEYRCQCLNFCTRKCQMLSLGKGKLRKKIELAWKKNSNNDDLINPSQDPIVKRKIRETSMKRYGTSHWWKNEDCQKQWRAIWKKKHGTSHPLSTPEIRQAGMETLVKIYGVDNGFKTPQCKERNTSLEAKIRYKKTSLKNFGFENPTQSSIIKQKRHETMKRNNSYGKSKIEDQCYNLLKNYFDDVERFFMYNNWSIDFCVNSNTLIQLDGIYWHGLNRPIEQISLHSSKRDVTIERTFYRDQRQNKEFHDDLNMNFLRITDIAFKKLKLIHENEPTSFSDFIDACYVKEIKM